MVAVRQFLNRHGKRLVVALPLAWLLLFFALPLVEVAQTSFTEPRRGIPPFLPLWGFGDDGFFTNFNLENYGLLLDYWQDYHAQLVVIGSRYCRPKNPRCEECPLAPLLPT